MYYLNASNVCLEKETFGFVPRLTGFSQPAYKTSIVNKTNVREIIEKNIQRYTCYFSIHFDLYQKLMENLQYNLARLDTSCESE